MTGALESLDVGRAWDPDDPLALVRAVEDLDPDKRVGAVASAVRRMAEAGMDAVGEAIVRDYVTRKELLSRSDFRAIVKESRPTPLEMPHTRTPGSDQAEQVCAPDGVCGAHPQLAEEKDLLAQAVETVQKLGVTGEARIIRGTFLTAVSQVLGEPVSLVVKGTSAGGKSYSTRCTLQLFPEDDFYCVTAGSQRSLIFTDEEFRHRTIVMFEATALREIAETRDGDMTAMIVRTLLSEGRIIYDITERADDGKMGTRRITKQGPTNLIVTTTADNLHHENETRLLSLTVDESEEQTRAVMRKIAARRNQAIPAEAPDLSGWHDLFHWLKYHGEHRVYIPYAEYLSGTAAAAVVRMRRDFGVLLGMIEAHAVLHQATRSRDDYGRIVATAADYTAALAILAEAFAISSGQQVKENVRRVVVAVGQLGGETSDVLTAQVTKCLKRDRTRVTRGLKEAVDLGYLVNLETKQGRPHRFRIADALPDDKPALPDSVPEPDGRTPAQGAHLSPQVSDGCAGVRGVRGGQDDKVFTAADETLRSAHIEEERVPPRASDPGEDLARDGTRENPLWAQQEDTPAADPAVRCTCPLPLDAVYRELGWTHHPGCPPPPGIHCSCSDCQAGR